jgi:hypothetical protein
MKLPRWITVIAVAGGLTIVVTGLLAFADTYAHNSAHCFDTIRSAQFPKWLGCAMAAHESLAGGMIGFAGAIIAAWLAYSAVQDQLRITDIQLRNAERLRAEEHLSAIARDIRALNAARNYLTSFARRFPEPNRVNFNDHDFAQTLSHLHQRAHVYISQSASAAPGEFGYRILTVMWRTQTLAENVQRREEKGQISFQDLKEEIRDSILEVWRIIDDLAGEIERRETHYGERIKQLEQLE